MKNLLRQATLRSPLLHRARQWFKRRFRHSFHDVGDTYTDPLHALAATDLPPVMSIELSRISHYWLPVRYADLVRNPFSRAALELRHDPSLEYRSSALHRYHDRWQPMTLGGVVGIGAAPGDPLARSPFAPDLLPWGDYRSFENLDDRESRQVAALARRFGGNDGRVHGKRDFGPVSEVAGDAYFEEYATLVASVAEHGYREGLGGHPRVELLVDDDDSWVGRALNGNHRLAVLAGLGHERASVVIERNVIRRRDFRHWSGVRIGLYRPDEALQVFDAFIRGRLPDGYPNLDE